MTTMMISDAVVLHPMRFHSFVVAGRLIAFGGIVDVDDDDGRLDQYFVFSAGNFHYRNLKCGLSFADLNLVCTLRRLVVEAVGFHNQMLRISYYYEWMHYLCGVLWI